MECTDINYAWDADSEICQGRAALSLCLLKANFTGYASSIQLNLLKVTKIDLKRGGGRKGLATFILVDYFHPCIKYNQGGFTTKHINFSSILVLSLFVQTFASVAKPGCGLTSIQLLVLWTGPLALVFNKRRWRGADEKWRRFYAVGIFTFLSSFLLPAEHFIQF